MSNKHDYKILGQVSDTDIRQLKIFRVVVDCGGFTAAASQLNVTRSAISSSMADLETRLGLKLCNRGRSGFSLTEPGRKIHRYIVELFEHLDDFRGKVNLVHSSLTGELHLGVVNNLISCPHMRIVNALRELKRHAPMVKINLLTMPPNEVERGVLAGDLDIGVVPKRQDDYGLTQHMLYSEHIGLYCGDLHPLYAIPHTEISHSLLIDHDMVAPNFPLIKDAKELYRDFKVTANVSDGESIAFLIMTGCFIGFLPANYASQWVKSGRFREILSEELYYTNHYVAITRGLQNRNPAADLFLKYMTDSTP